jgi:hypothetical protein
MSLHEDPDMDAQLARTLIGAYVEAADLGEALATAERVPPGDYDLWYEEWSRTASVAQDMAEKATGRGLHALAGRSFLRASEYNRQSYFFLRHDLEDERVRTGYRAQRDLFRRFSEFAPFRVDPISVPMDGVNLTGYVFRPAGGDEHPRPTVLMPGGFDGTAEEIQKYGARSALAMGWNAVVWDGPGQGGVLIEQRVTMRPDFEAVLTPVVDWALAQPFVREDALFVVGRSLGGYLAPRGVSAEHRIRALVCDPGQFDFTLRFIGMFSPEDWSRVERADPEMDAQLEGFISGARNLELYGSRMAAMGAATFGDWLRVMGSYTLEGRAEQISCPTLVTEGEGDFASQSQQLFDALQCDKMFHRFSAAEGAGGHCEGMGQMLWSDVTFSWLSDVLSGDDRKGAGQ